MNDYKLLKQNAKYISPDKAKTLHGLFDIRAKISPNDIAYKYYVKELGRWEYLLWHEIARKIKEWQSALINERLNKEDRVAIQLKNCPEWIIFDQSALSNNLVTVPLYMDDRPENIDFILDETRAVLLLVQNYFHLKKLEKVIAKNKFLKRILLLENIDDASIFSKLDKRVELVSDWLKKDMNHLPEKIGHNSNTLASIVYTSGTTGKPKGVMLSHLNMLSVAYGGLSMLDCFKTDVFLSFLPLSHTLERSVGYYAPVMSGATVAFARTASQLAEDLKIIRPTILVSVPRIFEKFFSRIEGQLEKKNFFIQYIFNLTNIIGWKKFNFEQGRGRKKISLFFWPIFEKLIAKKILNNLGGKLRLAICGGAPLNKNLSKFFISLGLPIIQGYGLTETSPIVSANPIDNNYPDSVGIPIKGVKVRISGNSELEVSGPGVMMGYWKNESATEKIIDKDGWLKTGDQAYIAESGHIYITGRLKDILVLSNGEKISPSDIELTISADPIIKNIILIGEGLPFLTAILSIDQKYFFDSFREFGFEEQKHITDLEKDIKNSAVKKIILKRLNKRLSSFPIYAKIRNAHLVFDDWTIENDLLTPTMKLKRGKIIDKYKNYVENLY